MSIEKVRSFFRSYGMEDRILEFAESSATVELTPEEMEKYSGAVGWVDVCK